MARRLEHARARELELQRALRIEVGHREPLPRDRNAILAAGVADLARRDAGCARQPARDLLGRALALLDPDEACDRPLRSARRRGARRPRSLRERRDARARRSEQRELVAGRERAPVQRRGAEAAQRVQMFGRRVAHVARESVAGMHALEARHDRVAVHLRDDRRRRDRAVARVAADQSGLRRRRCRESCARRRARDRATDRARARRGASPRVPRDRR